MAAGPKTPGNFLMSFIRTQTVDNNFSEDLIAAATQQQPGQRSVILQGFYQGTPKAYVGSSATQIVASNLAQRLQSAGCA